MSLNEGVRRIHRWIAVAFTVGVVTNMVVLGRADKAHPEPYPMWLGLIALLPLIVLELTGIYLFVLPYAARWRRRETT